MWSETSTAASGDYECGRTPMRQSNDDTPSTFRGPMPVTFSVASPPQQLSSTNLDHAVDGRRDAVRDGDFVALPEWVTEINQGGIHRVGQKKWWDEDAGTGFSRAACWVVGVTGGVMLEILEFVLTSMATIPANAPNVLAICAFA